MAEALCHKGPQDSQYNITYEDLSEMTEHDERGFLYVKTVQQDF